MACCQRAAQRSSSMGIDAPASGLAFEECAGVSRGEKRAAGTGNLTPNFEPIPSSPYPPIIETFVLSPGMKTLPARTTNRPFNTLTATLRKLDPRRRLI